MAASRCLGRPKHSENEATSNRDTPGRRRAEMTTGATKLGSMQPIARAGRRGHAYGLSMAYKGLKTFPDRKQARRCLRSHVRPAHRLDRRAADKRPERGAARECPGCPECPETSLELRKLRYRTATVASVGRPRCPAPLIPCPGVGSGRKRSCCNTRRRQAEQWCSALSRPVR